MYIYIYMIHVYTYTFERVIFRYTGADIGMLSRYDLKCIRVRWVMPNDWRSTYSLVSLTGTEIILVYIHISWHCCSTMPRAKPCLKTSISVTVDVQSNASVCFHPHCGSVVWDVFFRECRWPISRAKWPTEWKNPQSMLKIHGVLPQQRASFSVT